MLQIADGAFLLKEFALPCEDEIIKSVFEVESLSPFSKVLTPGGRPFSISMTNCGTWGWVSDHAGYRYEKGPNENTQWPSMPLPLVKLANEAAQTAGYENFIPDCCLMNCYMPGSRLGLHQDKDELDFEKPIVSVSLGIPATFLFGTLKRTDPTQQIALLHGDVVVWGGSSRKFYHGISTIKEDFHEKIGKRRINLTFRKTGL